MKNLTLQWRIALLTALILAVSSIALTAAAMVNAEHSFMALMEETFSMPPEDAVPTEPYPEGTVVAGGAAEQAQVAKRGFDLRSVLSCVIITALGSVVAYYVAGKALAPLRKLSESVATIDEHTLSQRLPAATAKDEVGALTEGFNGMLTRLDDAFLRQKRFTANAAHELKTPLATMKTGAQVLSADESATLTDYQEHAKSTLMTVDRMAAVVDDLLLLASAGENMVHEQEEVLLDALFEAIQSELALSLERRDMRCTVHCGDLSVAGTHPCSTGLFSIWWRTPANMGGRVDISKLPHKRWMRRSLFPWRTDGPGSPRSTYPTFLTHFIGQISPAPGDGRFWPGPVYCKKHDRSVRRQDYRRQ